MDAYEFIFEHILCNFHAIRNGQPMKLVNLYSYICICIYIYSLSSIGSAFAAEFFVAYCFPSYMAFGTLPKGLEKYAGSGEACTLPIDAMTYVLIDFLRFLWISGGCEGLGGCREACTLPIDARACIFIELIDFH